MAAICKDCSVDTTPCTGKRGCRHKGRWEYYMVDKELWKAAQMQEGFLCIGCLEGRIGRQLRPHDFTSAPINDPEHPWDTERLRSRKNEGRETMPKRIETHTKRGTNPAAVNLLRENIARVIDPKAMSLRDMLSSQDATPDAKIPPNVRKALEKSDAVIAVIRDTFAEGMKSLEAEQAIASSQRDQARELKLRAAREGE